MDTIYVAGASAEIVRAEAFMEAASQIRGLTVNSGWARYIREREAKGLHYVDLTREERIHYAKLDLESVRAATVFALLVPVVQTTIGAWVEFGFAVSQSMHLRCTTLVVGPRVSLFCELADVHYETDAAALDFLREFTG